MIEVQGLSKTFGFHKALDSVDLRVAAGERVVLVGPNGAGKTTLLRILATLERPTAGVLRLGGEDPARAGAGVRRQIGFLSHQSLLYDDLTVEQNLAFYARMYGLKDGPARIAALLKQVGLQQRSGDLVRTLSRGMQQRLAVARAVLHRPRLLLLDEPYTGLDPLAAEALTALLAQVLEEGCTLLLTTHHPGIEGGLGERVVVLLRGRVAYDGPFDAPAEFPERYRELVKGSAHA